MITPEQRDKHPLCGAKKKNGDTCRLFAGQGTDHHGFGRCKHHGGSTRNGRKRAATIEAKSRMVKLGVPIEDITAPAALLGLLSATAGHVAWLHGQVGDIDDLSDHESEVVLRLYDAERDRLTRIGEACVRAGVAEAQVRVLQSQVEVLGSALQKATQRAGLSDAQRRKLGNALREELLKTEKRSRRAVDADIFEAA